MYLTPEQGRVANDQQLHLAGLLIKFQSVTPLNRILP
jgi:hypothetical protein